MIQAYSRINSFQLKGLMIIVACFVFTTALVGQDWQWGQQISGDGDVLPIDIVLDESDNIYVIGTFTGTSLTIGPDSYSNFGDWDVFLASFDPDGVYRWSKQIAGSGRDDASALDIDGDGNVYLAGSFRDETIFFSENDSLENTNNYDAYMAVYSQGGSFIQASKLFWGNETEKILDLIVESENDQIIVTGNFKAELVYFNGISEQVVNAVGPKDQFIAKFNSDGGLSQMSVFDVTKKETTFKQIEKCKTGGYYIGGDLRDRINFSETEYLQGDTSNMDILVAFFDDNLNYQWGRLGKGTGFDHVNSAVSDEYGNFYITGKMESSPIRFDSTESLESNPVFGFGLSDMYLVKYNPSGILQWITRNGNAGDDDGYGLAYFNGIVQFAGNYSGSVIFNQDTLDSGSLSNINTGFAKFDPDGNAVGAEQTFGIDEDRSTAVSFDSNGETVIAGFFSSPNLQAGSIELSNAGNPLSDGFLFKYVYPFSVVFSEVLHPGCPGNADGELTVEPYFGVSPYEYAWAHDPSLTLPKATNLAAGEYTVSVTDATGETVENAITLYDPSPIELVTLTINVSCYGGNDGSIEINVTGGTGDYSFLWTTENGSGIIPTHANQSGLTPGIYILTVSDENGCTKNESYTITAPEAISFGGSYVEDIVYPEGENGAIWLTVSGGTPDYSFSWTGPEGYVSQDKDIDSLQAEGTYSVLLSDGNACVADTSFNLLSNSEELMAFIKTKKDVSCYGGNDGEATVTVIGAQGTLHYKWRDSEGVHIGYDCPSISGLMAGEYSVTVYDFRKCHAIAYVTINQPEAPLQVSVETTDIRCFGEQNGIIDLFSSGGTAPYSYLWSTGATTEDLVNLGAGIYSVIISDANGCLLEEEITITEPTRLQNEIILENAILCNGDRTAVASVITTGGMAPYTYLWDDPAGQISSTAVNLGSGNYSVISTDINGCVAIDEIEITEPPAIVISHNQIDVSCFGGTDASIEVLATGGNSPFVYLWSNGEEGNILDQIPAGVYDLMVLDFNQCQKTASFEIQQPLELEIISSVVNDISCFGNHDGIIEITGSGGTGPYEYTLSPGDIVNETGLFSELASGIYTVILNDSRNCGPAQMEDLSVIEPDPIIIDSLKFSDETGNGEMDGSISIFASGGNPDLSFTLYPGAVQNFTGEFVGLESGTYYVEVTDENKCGPTTSDDIYIGNLAITDIDPDLKVFIFPNPSEGYLRIEIVDPRENEIKLEIISMNGVVIYSDKLKTGYNNKMVREVNLSEQAQGIYILKLSGERTSSLSKIILK